MKVGTLCYATDSGLGILAKAFFDNGVVTHPVVVRHGRHPTHDEWYPGAPQISDLRDARQVHEAAIHLKQCDVVLFFETPFRWELITEFRLAKIKTVFMPMYECCFPVFPAEPDFIINPSALDQRYYPRGVHIPVPVSVPWRLRTKAEVFVHNAGHGGLKGRNGTAELLEAWKYVKSDAQLMVRSQKPLFNTREEAESKLGGTKGVVITHGTIPYDALYQWGDVFVFPEKFNGLSLPLQEAFAVGMLVMATDRFPNTTYLPCEPLIPTRGSNRNRIGPPYNEFDEAVVDPKAIAAKIDEWYGRDITEYSERGREYAGENSWERLKPRYLEVLSNALGQ